MAGFYLDTSSLAIVRELCPTVEVAVACCFEEGVPTFHGTNNSWYLFNEGGHWGPWYPSKTHTLRPAENEEDALGIVAVPHLARDMVLSVESRGDFYSNHPPNVLRGKGNDGAECPYSLNLIDQCRAQEDYNHGFSYMNLFVSTPWLTHSMNFEESPEVACKLYRESLEYLAALRGQGAVSDMHLSEFGAWYKANRPIGGADVYLAKEILYGSGKDYIWYINPFFRVLIDTTQGGAIVDLRPYVGKAAGATGPDTPRLADGSYPFLIQSQRRTGFANHAFDGARTTLNVSLGDESFDLARCRTNCALLVRQNDAVTATLTPACVRFQNGIEVRIRTTYRFPGNNRIQIERAIEAPKTCGDLLLEEYVKGSYGRTEYPEDMHGIDLFVDGDTSATLEYNYRNRTLESKHAVRVGATIPQVNAEVSLEPLKRGDALGRAHEGFLFCPFYTLTLSRVVEPGKGMHTCLSVARIV